MREQAWWEAPGRFGRGVKDLLGDRPPGERRGPALSSRQQSSSPARLFTIGHSTRPFSELVDLLNEHGVRQLVDVRHLPRSRRNPQFNLKTLATALPERGIAYVWEGESLGGFRSGGFQGYMQFGSFQQGLRRLESLVAIAPTAIMCAEVVSIRCHRRFIAREMVRRGYSVTHIINAGKKGNEEPLPRDMDEA